MMIYFWIALAIYFSGYVATFVFGETLSYFMEGINKQDIKEGLLVSLLSWVGLILLLIFSIGMIFDTLPDFHFQHKRGGK